MDILSRSQLYHVRTYRYVHTYLRTYVATVYVHYTILVVLNKRTKKVLFT